MLLNIVGWEIYDLGTNFNFYSIIEEVQSMAITKDFAFNELLSYFRNDFGLNKMDVDLISNEIEPKNSVPEEEEKIETSNTISVSKNIDDKGYDPNTIPTSLYMITPDYYFTLPEVDRTLEELTMKYYKIKCSLCHKITKRGAICLI
jgi:hypothetical protein